MNAITNDLHARLDALGAPPREQYDPAPTPVQEIGLSDESNQLAEELTGASEEGENPEGVETPGENQEVEPATAQDDAPESYTAADFASEIGWETAELYERLRVPLVNGETLTLSEMKDRYDTLAAQQAEVQKQREQLQQQSLQPQQALVSEEIQKAESMKHDIQARYAMVNWDELDASEPGKAANWRQKFTIAMTQAEKKLGEATAKAQAEQQTAFNEAVARESQRLVEFIPEWKDSGVMQQEQKEVAAYLEEVGFQPQELQNIFDARARRVAREAWLWRKHQANVDKTVLKARKAPKPLRPGAGVDKKQIAEAGIQKLEQRALNTGQASDKLAAARAIFGNS